MKKILIVEDERRLREILARYFVSEGYIVFEAGDGMSAYEYVKKEAIDVIIMDIMMPIMDGFEATKLIRSISSAIIIMLTAREEDEDKIKGLEFGADEYVTKPFSPKVLVARVKALLKRIEKEEEAAEIYHAGHIKINRSNYEVYDNEVEIILSPKEFDLLQLLVAHKNNVLTRENILDQVWGYDYYGDYRTVDTHIKKLRKKLPYSSECIKTIVRVGYKFEVK